VDHSGGGSLRRVDHSGGWITQAGGSHAESGHTEYIMLLVICSPGEIFCIFCSFCIFCIFRFLHLLRTHTHTHTFSAYVSLSVVSLFPQALG
jgi:cell division protein FtsW (lipid II flippase)